jgi:glycine oxidase
MLAPFSEEMPDAAMLALCTASLGRYPAFVDELRERTGVDARFRRDGTMHVAQSDPELAALAACAHTYRTNGGDVHLLDRGELMAREPALGAQVRGGVFIANEAQVDNRRLGRALVAACEGLGVRFERSPELTLEADARRVRGLRSSHGFVPVPAIVNAAGAWAGMLEGVPERARVRVHPIAGEMLALAVPKNFVRALIWLGHTYLVPRDDGRLLIGATVEDRGFDARVTAAGVQGLLAAALRGVPSLGSFAVVETWAGLRPGSADGRPFLGQGALDGYFVAAGHFRNGILLTPVTAAVLAAAVSGEASPVDVRAFDPCRVLPGTSGALAN